MKFLYRKSFVIFALLSFLVPGFVFAYSSPGNPSGYVNDFAGVFTPEQKGVLENKLSAFNASTTNEIAVVTVKSLGGDYIENYAVQLFKEWGIGTKKNDNGVLLLIAVDDHKMRIEVGYGLEGALTDSLSSQIIRNDLTPAFKQGDFYGGVNVATDHIIEATRGEYQSSGNVSSGKDATQAYLFIFFMIISFLGAILGRSKSWWLGGVLGFIFGVIVTYLFHASLGVSLIILAVLTTLGLLFDYIVSSAYTRAQDSGTNPPWWAGGAGRGGDSGSDSFGGFSGGSSGGGGASGSW